MGPIQSQFQCFMIPSLHLQSTESINWWRNVWEWSCIFFYVIANHPLSLHLIYKIVWPLHFTFMHLANTYPKRFTKDKTKAVCQGTNKIHNIQWQVYLTTRLGVHSWGTGSSAPFLNLTVFLFISHKWKGKFWADIMWARWCTGVTTRHLN